MIKEYLKVEEEEYAELQYNDYIGSMFFKSPYEAEAVKKTRLVKINKSNK